MSETRKTRKMLKSTVNLQREFKEKIKDIDNEWVEKWNYLFEKQEKLFQEINHDLQDWNEQVHEIYDELNETVTELTRQIDEVYNTYSEEQKELLSDNMDIYGTIKFQPPPEDLKIDEECYPLK